MKVKDHPDFLLTSLVFILVALGLVTVYSSGAIYAAETAVEWCLYVNRVGSAGVPVMSNGATFVNGRTNNAPFLEADCNSRPIKALGMYRGVTRSFEINF